MDPETTEPILIAEYHETRFEGKRHFQLFENVIRIEGKVFLNSEFETDVPLEVLRPERELIRIRSSLFRSGLWVLIGSILAAAIAKVNVPYFGDNAVLATFGFSTFAFCGFVMVLLGLPKILFVRYKSESGVVALDIARAGKQKERFETFVEAVENQVRKVRETR